jgi:hypothetical protein
MLAKSKSTGERPAKKPKAILKDLIIILSLRFNNIAFFLKCLCNRLKYLYPTRDCRYDSTSFLDVRSIRAGPIAKEISEYVFSKPAS